MQRLIKRWVLSILFWGQQLYWRWHAPVIVGVRGIILNRGRVLLVKHEYGERHLWYLPGGAVKRKETLIEALCREAKEEVNADIQVHRLQGVYYNPSQGASDHISVFVASLNNPEALKPGWEIASFTLSDPEALPASTSPATRRRLQEYLTEASSSEYRLW